ncbi:hypothetical protein QYF36_021906 [Acer negundo]|nr:hypothetical protein QYF36_021906 [Acer negundo]
MLPPMERIVKERTGMVERSVLSKKRYGKKVKGVSDVKGLPPKAMAFQNSNEVIGRMGGQHANLASHGETSYFSSESDIIGMWKGESYSKNRAMWLGKFGSVD